MTYTFWSSNTGGDGPTPPDPPRGTSNSLRFRGAEYLASETNLTASETTTFSMWFKLGEGQLGQTGTDSIPLSQSGGGGINQIVFNATGTITGDGTATQNCATSSVYRDPGAWYHLVYTRGVNETRLFINGEETPYSTFTTGAGAAITSPTLPLTIGTVNNASSLFFEGYMSDVYFIDGQALEPTAFGRYNEDGVWVPREVDFTPAEMRYSDMCTELLYPQFFFDGDLETYSYDSGATTTIEPEFKPVPAIPVTSTIELYTSNTSYTECSINGGAWQSIGDTDKEWYSISFTGNLESLKFRTEGAVQVYLRAIKVDGTMLLNPYYYSADLISSTGAFSGTPANAFDGNPNTLCGANSSAAGTTLTWAPSTPINFTQKVEVVVNQDNTASYGSESAVQGVAGTYITLYEGSGVIDAANPIVSYASPGVSYPYFYAFRIDGQIYVDGANPSYGANGFHLEFRDPDNLGLDTSGNDNNFTAEGFNTDPVGIFTDAMFTSPGYGNIDYNSTAKLFQSESPVTNGFNGESTNFVQCEPDNSWFFKPQNLVASKIEIQVTNAYGDPTGGSLEFNGVEQTGFPGQAWYTIYEGSPITDWTIGGWYKPAGGNGFSMIRVNGSILIDNTGTDYDLMQDGPSQNYATLNPLVPGPTPVFGNANLSSADTNGNFGQVAPSTILLTGKKYWECTVINGSNSYPYLGLTAINGINNTNSSYFGNNSFFYIGDGRVKNFGTNESSNFTGLTNGDIFSFAYDADIREITVKKNGDEATASTYTLNTDQTEFTPAIITALSQEATINVGQQPFLYTPPAGFEALQTQNLPAAPIANGRDHFQAITAAPGVGSIGGGQRGGNFSTYVTANPDFYAGAGPELMFDGSTSTITQSSTEGGSITFAPNPPIDYTSEVVIHSYRNATDQAVLNGGSPVSMAAGGVPGETVIATGSGTINSIVTSGYYGGNVGYIKVDGEILVDAGPLAAAQQTFPNGMWWIKDRNNNTNHQLLDSVRGALWTLQPNTAQSEQEYSAPLGDSVAWCWRAGESSVTDNTGSIESQVCVNEEAGFSIVQWVGSGGFDSIGHGLGRRPGMVITRSRQGDHWIVGIDGYTTLSGGGSPSQWLNTDSFVGTNWANGLILNSYNASTTYVASSGINISGNTMMGYVWAPVEGYSAFGQYQGNGLSDGTFIYTGFRPAFVMIKCASNGTEDVTNWFIQDSTREPYNPCADPLAANTSLPEYDFSSALIDLVSNGFKLRGGPDQMNGNKTYVYAAFAENPFGGSNVSPANAR